MKKKPVIIGESETVKSQIRYEILDLIGNDKEIQRVLERCRYSIKELEQLRDNFKRQVKIKNEVN